MIAGKILDGDEYNWGFDAQTGEFKGLGLLSTCFRSTGADCKRTRADRCSTVDPASDCGS